MQRYTEAIGMFTNYIKTNNTCLDVYYKRAICYYEIKEYIEAIKDLSFIINKINKYSIKHEKKKNNSYQFEKENNICNELDTSDFNTEINDSIYYCEEEKNNKNNEINNNMQDIYLLRGKALFNLNEIDKALNDFNEFFSLLKAEKKNIENFKNNKDLTTAYFNRGYCYFIKKQYLLSLKDYEKTLELDSSYTSAYFNMAICLYNLNRKKESIYFYEKIINECPTDIEALLGLCKSYRDIGDSKKALESVEKGLLIFKDNSPKISNLYYESGMCLFDLKKYEEAINSFEKAIELCNINKKILLSDCYYHKGICLLKINKKEKGFKDFNEAIKYNSKNGEIYNYKGYYYMDNENYIEAINSYIKAIDINKELYTNKIDGYFNIAYCYLQLEKFKEAKKYLTLSQKINEEKIKIYFKNGLSLCNEGMKVQEYLLDFSKLYKKIKNKFIDINYFLGISNIELKQYEEAINNFEMCNKYDNKFGDGYYYKGIVYSKLKKYQKAIEQYKKAIECDNNIQIYKQALKNEENKLQLLYNKIETAEIDLFNSSNIYLNEKNNGLITPNKKKKNKNNIIMLNKSLNIKKNSNNKNCFGHISSKNLMNKYKNSNFKKRNSMSTKIKLINLSQSSKGLIQFNLNDNISNYEKNERIRKIINKNSTKDITPKKELQSRISKKFYKRHWYKPKNIDKNNIAFLNKLQKIKELKKINKNSI